jgi:hypothetical protein
MQQLHVGSGTSRGALSVFPVWGEVEIERDYTTSAAAAAVSEKPSPEVSTLMVGNSADRPLLLLEGRLLEGGMQNRMVARSVVVPSSEEVPVDVVCVEQGRWSGERRHTDFARRATTRVQAGLRAEGNRQGEVWRRVSEYDARYGPNATSSFTEHAKRAGDDVAPLIRGLRPFPAQIGIVVAISGHPVSAELFDCPSTLAEQFESIVRAAAMDAVGRRAEVTPSRRARSFIDRASTVDLHRSGPAGAGYTFVGTSEYASISQLQWHDRDVHTSLLNPRHELVGAV